jgi:hypothetical protein
VVTQRAKLIDLIVQAEMAAPSSYMKGQPFQLFEQAAFRMISAHCATLCIRWIGGTVLCMDWESRLRRYCLLDKARLPRPEKLPIGQDPFADKT